MAKTTGKQIGHSIGISWERRSPQPVRVEIINKNKPVKTGGVIEEVHGWVPRKKPTHPVENRLYLEEGE